jgi:hypothetical protein
MSTYICDIFFLSLTTVALLLLSMPNRLTLYKGVECGRGVKKRFTPTLTHTLGLKCETRYSC